jgi:uncharacterized protein YueI
MFSVMLISLFFSCSFLYLCVLSDRLLFLELLFWKTFQHADYLSNDNTAAPLTLEQKQEMQDKYNTYIDETNDNGFDDEIIAEEEGAIDLDIILNQMEKKQALLLEETNKSLELEDEDEIELAPGEWKNNEDGRKKPWTKEEDKTLMENYPV